ncbi:MAG: hypothetical protein GSR73_02255 [Desulfurococcales archaeon]|nr:hypothetical protein [Desulfurococcales archaeon]
MNAIEDLTEIETLILCAIYRKVGFATGRKPANIPLQAIHSPLKTLGISKREVREALKSLIKKSLARPYEKRNTYTLTRKGAMLAHQICPGEWDIIRDKLKRD